MTADYVKISGFMLEDASAGIRIKSADSCNIYNNKFNECHITLDDSKNNSIYNNTCSDSENGILLEGSGSNNIYNNNCSNNVRGIYLENSVNNSVFNNTCSNNGDGIRHDSRYPYNSHHNNIFNNTCSNNGRGISLRGCHRISVPSS